MCEFHDMGCCNSINQGRRKTKESHETARPATPDRHHSIQIQFDEEDERTGWRERTSAEGCSAVNVNRRSSRSSVNKLVLEVMDVLRLLTEK